MDGIIRVSAIAMAVLMVITSVCILTDGSDAVSDHGTSAKPLTEFVHNGLELNDDSDRTYYVKVGSDVSITSGTKSGGMNSYSFYPSSVSSGFGLTKGIAKVTGT
ncbi:MAG: hypothetical protein IJ248_06775, partial [Candidatus Methanomethylophilaceae archaeon]|nr:hypothetical protein [Candidatus Methanomethylophilaceae archaeon]